MARSFADAAAEWEEFAGDKPGYQDLVGMSEILIEIGENRKALPLLRIAEGKNCAERDYLLSLIADAAYGSGDIDLAKKYLGMAEDKVAQRRARYENLEKRAGPGTYYSDLVVDRIDKIREKINQSHSGEAD